MNTGFTTRGAFRCLAYGRSADVDRSRSRSEYADFLNRQKLADGTLAWLIQRVINDVAANPHMRQLSPRFLYHLDLLKRSVLGPKMALQLTEQDLTAWLRERAQGVGKATCKHDLRTLIYVFKHAKAMFSDCREIPLKAITEATPYLLLNGLVGAGAIRQRKCSNEEREALVGYFEEENRRGRNEIKAMPDIIRYALISSRRRGEICSIVHADTDYERELYWVRNMKHPTRKSGNHKPFVLWPELAEIVQRQPRAANDDRIFPFNGNVIGQKFSAAVRKLGIADLHFHDLRGSAISMWLLRGLTIEEVRVAVSGHDNSKVLELVYDRRTAVDMVDRAKFRTFLDAANDTSAPLARAA